MRLSTLLLVFLILLFAALTYAEVGESGSDTPLDRDIFPAEEQSPKLIISADGSWFIYWRSERGQRRIDAGSGVSDEGGEEDARTWFDTQYRGSSDERGRLILKINDSGYSLEWDMQSKKEERGVGHLHRGPTEFLIIH